MERVSKKMKKHPFTIVLMAHNEEKTIEAEVLQYYNQIIRKTPGSEFIIAEDGSTDQTRMIIERLAKHIPVTPLPVSQRKGYAGSLRNAIERAKGDVIFYVDGGRKHDPKDFWKAYKHLDSYDFVVGYKHPRVDAWYRRFLAWGLNELIALYFGVRFHDIDCGFKLLGKRAKKIILSEKWIMNNNISTEICLRLHAAGCSYREIPIKHNKRTDGPSRGLPVAKIPRVVYRLLSMFPTLKREIYYSYPVSAQSKSKTLHTVRTKRRSLA